MPNELLEGIYEKLSDITALMNTSFGEMMHAFAGTSYSIRKQMRDFTPFIEEKTRSFVGRQWVFDEVHAFIEKNPFGYFFIVGDPGIGKSALAAQMVKMNGYVHHFNISAEGINTAAAFLKNVCAQLIATYGLEQTELPPETADDAGFLKKLLEEVSGKLEPREHCVIVVDALDEVYKVGHPHDSNLLYLPVTLPEGIYMLLTTRRDPNVMPRIEVPHVERLIKNDSMHNLDDVRDFITASTDRFGIKTYIKSQSIDKRFFIDHLLEKSEGNFMYLRYVLPEIESGAYKDLDLEIIPAGLQNYYEDHWRRMRGADEEAWFNYKLLIICALTVVREPISIEMITHFSKKIDKSRIRALLRKWSGFIHEEEVEYEGGTQQRYRLYHDSFFDFVAAKQEVADERVDLKATEALIADTLWDDLFVVDQDG